ncbi:helix-turn-helix domain-containing protein [Propionispora hippei]|uniref:AraC-type DNA-binding protein n=1 Tax=Propionispora hippei DSM 15287 TaxID=1123003 RepID=A0A1M6DPS8_9FIRM|nr:AraC family transcriptional regulator [Propionispora hippei]SHI75149.1 AraC-type DNA-binding protein [Propionispora hippei DSM 15287]
MGMAAYYRSQQLEIIHLKDWQITYHEHNHVSIYTIGFVLAGAVTLICEEQAVAVQPGHFFIIKPYQMHALLLPSVYNMIAVCLPKELMEQHNANSLREILSQNIARLDLSIKATCLETAVGALYQGEPPLSLDGDLLASVKHLRLNPENNSTIQNMADSMYFSKYYYIKRFKQKLGMTPHQFQLQNKVRKAQRMLENGKPLTVIAADLGFYDQSHFIKCFKQIIGLTPAVYRQAVSRLP